jgi:hypothetical protein
MKWTYLFNIHIIAAVLIFIAVLFLVKKGRSKNGAIDAFNEIVTDALDEHKDVFSERIKKKKKKCEKKFERRCREIFEDITGEEFKSIRPHWLKNPKTNKNLELDGYAERIKTAFEYDGNQHSQFNPHYHKDIEDFNYQVKKDIFKDKKCKELGIKLIRIPSFVIFDDLERYIVMRCKQEKVPLIKTP